MTSDQNQHPERQHSESPQPISHRWRDKFRCAFWGLYLGTRGQDSFIVHVPAALAVLALAAWLRLPASHWCLLLLAIGLVMATELVNSALEHLVRGTHPEHHPLIGEALDIASAAVLVASFTAVAVGLFVFLPPLWQWWMGIP